MSIIVIPVTENLRISSPDHLNYTLEKRRVVEKGKNAGQEQWDVLGYFSTLKGVATSLVKGNMNLYLNAEDKEVTMDLKTLIAAVDEAADHIARSCESAATKLAARPVRTPVVAGEME